MSDKFPGGFLTAGAPAGFSVAFDGTGDYLTTSSGTSLGAGNFTIECWVYLTAAAAGETTVGSSADYYTAGFNGNFVFRVGTQNLWRSFDAQSNQATIDGTFTWATGQWYHMAWVRNSGTVTVYRNGVSLGSVADSKTLSDSANGYAIAATKSSGSYSSLLTGYISNLRVVVGTALYTTTFTPPTQLLNISGTSFLTCNSPTIIDQSTNAYTITTVGDSKVSNFTPFAAYTGFNPALGAAAGGVWTLDEAAYYQNNRQWPIYDPYFNQTTLMLHGNGTNGAQNNTFLDSSTNNFTITRNGNTTQGTFTPFSQTGWSYNGTAGAYCQLNNADYSLGTGDFTVEFWMYCVDDFSYSAVTFASAPSNPNFTVALTNGSSNARLAYLEYGGGGTLFGTLSGYLNKWTHVAFVRTSGNVVVYQNGVATAAPISKSASVGSTASLYLARNSGDSGSDFRGYLSNFRITKAAVYTSNFTPSTAPFVPVSNTVLLTFQDNRFRDSSALNATVTPAGTASIQAFSPFVPAYITPTTYSNIFDNSGDYLTVPNNAAFALPGDFTVEGWFNFTQQAASNQIMTLGSEASAQNGFSIYNPTGTEVRFYSNGATIVTTSGAALAVNTWYHIAVVRSGSGSNNLVIYVNGISKGTATNTTSFTGLAGNGVCIGTSYSGTYGGNYGGAISNFRIVKGTAVYTAAFTPPTAPLTNISGTSLLTCQSNTFIDNSTNAFTITAVGNTQPVTSPTPFPAKVDTTTLNSAYSTSLIGGSAYLDGSGDYLNLASAINFGTNNFTIEGWFYISSFNQQGFFGESNGGGANPKIQLYIYPTNSLTFDFGTNTVSGISGLTASNYLKLYSWNHIAVCRSGTGTNQTALFINGVRAGVGTTGNQTGVTDTFKIGNNELGVMSAGYISGFRIVNGSSVYDPTQTGFAPPVAPPTAIANTSLLLNFTNAGIFDDTAKNVLETVGSAQLSSTQAKYGGTSMYFNGSTSYLTRPYSPLFALGSGNFTVEAWINTTQNGSSDYPSVVGRWAGGNSWDLRHSAADNAGKPTFAYNNGSANANLSSTGSTIYDGLWHHLCVVRNGNTLTMYVDGVSVATASFSGTIAAATSTPLTVGSTSGTAYYTGYIDDLRITVGVARYLTNFTPPTSALQNQ